MGGRALQGPGPSSRFPVVYRRAGRARPSPIGVINLTEPSGRRTPSPPGTASSSRRSRTRSGAAVEERPPGRARIRGNRRIPARKWRLAARSAGSSCLPSPLVVAAKGRTWPRARPAPADSVGGDFYNLLRPARRTRIGVIDRRTCPSPTGSGAAVDHGAGDGGRSGIHAGGRRSSPSESAGTDGRLPRRGAGAHTEMFLEPCFYACDRDPAAGRIAYANAGHPHAFLVDGATGEAEGGSRPRGPAPGPRRGPGRSAARPLGAAPRKRFSPLFTTVFGRRPQHEARGSAFRGREAACSVTLKKTCAPVPARRDPRGPRLPPNNRRLHRWRPRPATTATLVLPSRL